MRRSATLVALFGLLTAASQAAAQGAPAEPPELPTPAVAAPIVIAPLAPPDAFSTAGRETGLPAELWRGTSAEILRAVLPMLSARPLSPAASALGRRLLLTGAAAPPGVGDDPSMLAARASALLALGEVRAAANLLSRASGLDRNSSLARAAAESALLSGDDQQACSIAQALTVDRDDVYWLRLRAFCQTLSGQTAAAQLTFELAQTQAKDAAFARLMGARLSGSPAGAASLRNGLDYALSRSLGLDVSSAAAAAAPVAAALTGGSPAEPAWSLTSGYSSLATALAAGGETLQAELTRWADQAVLETPARRGSVQAAVLLASAATPSPSATLRGRLASFTVPAGAAPAGRLLALSLAAEERRVGEAALLALWIAADAGREGPMLGDRIAIVSALQRVGLLTDGNNFALEGLAGLP